MLACNHAREHGPSPAEGERNHTPEVMELHSIQEQAPPKHHGTGVEELASTCTNTYRHPKEVPQPTPDNKRDIALPVILIGL